MIDSDGSDESENCGSDDEPEVDPDYVSSSDENDEQAYPREKRAKIVEYWWNNGKKRKFSSVQQNYRKLKNEKLLYTWKARIAAGIFF